MEKSNNTEQTSEKRPVKPTGRLKDGSLIIASIIVILTGLHAARGILGPIFMATFFTVLLIMPINWLRSKGISSWLARTVVILGVIVVGLGAFTVIGSQLAQFATDIPSYRDRFNEMLSENNVNVNIDDFFPDFLKSSSPKVEQNESTGEEQNDLGINLGKAVKPSFVTGVYAASAVGSTADVVVENVETEGTETKEPSEIASPAQINQAIWDSSASADGLMPSAPPTIFDEQPTLPRESNATEPIDATVETESVAQDEPNANSETENEGEVGEKEQAEAYRPLLVETGTAVRASSQELFKFLGGLARELSYFGSSAFLITLMVVFMLCETAVLPMKLVAVWGRRKFSNSHIENVISDIRHYMVIKTWMSLAVGVLVTILLVVSRVQYPLLWGFVAFLLNYIPNIGSVVAAIPPVVLATIEQGPVVGAVDAFFFVVINCGIGYGLEPNLLGDGLDLSPLVVLLALIFFGWLFGPVGMFLSPPLAVVMKIILQSFPETRWIAALMANRPPQEMVDETPGAAEANAK